MSIEINERLPAATQCFIDGQWLQLDNCEQIDVVDPSTECALGKVALASGREVEAAVLAARNALGRFSRTSVAERLDLLNEINSRLVARNDDIAFAISSEMGAPRKLARGAQAKSGTQHFAEAIRVLSEFEFTRTLGSTEVRFEPVGVSALITPWNWPINQISTKVAPALAAGCTMVLKPSEMASYSAMVFAEVPEEAGVPNGVFNLINGTGEDAGKKRTSHSSVDFISFTGSTRAGVSIGQTAAGAVKRVTLELGGKAAGLWLDDANPEKAVPQIVEAAMSNSGQSCNA